MELTGECLIPASQQRTWDALNNPEVLKAYIAGCETLERDGDNALNAAMPVRVGPVSARFKCRLQLSDVQPPSRYTIHFDGQGGVVGFGRGSADVTLAPACRRCRASCEPDSSSGDRAQIIEHSCRSPLRRTALGPEVVCPLVAEQRLWGRAGERP